MGEMALRGWLIRAGAEHADAVGDARRAQPLDRDADLDIAGKAQRREIGAAGFDHQADRVAALDVEQPRLDQPAFTAVSNHW